VTIPVRYGEHAVAEPGTPCLLCADPSPLPRTDHCHAHGWVRGVLCPRCNTLMAFIDRRASLRKSSVVEPPMLAALVAHAARCPDCKPFGVEDLGATRGLATKTPLERVTITLGVPASLKTWLAAYAKARGLSLNAAGIVLLDQALSETTEPPPHS